jgi:hypothetical protein
MPQGYYTIEQWTTPHDGGRSQWIAILHLPFGRSLTDAEHTLEQLGQPGFYRLVQTQRVIWVEKVAGTMRLRKAHAASPENLDEMRQIFERSGGRYPLEDVRASRRQAKKSQSH